MVDYSQYHEYDAPFASQIIADAHHKAFLTWAKEHASEVRGQTGSAIRFALKAGERQLLQHGGFNWKMPQARGGKSLHAEMAKLAKAGDKSISRNRDGAYIHDTIAGTVIVTSPQYVGNPYQVVYTTGGNAMLDAMQAKGLVGSDGFLIGGYEEESVMDRLSEHYARRRKQCD